MRVDRLVPSLIMLLLLGAPPSTLSHCRSARSPGPLQTPPALLLRVSRLHSPAPFF